MQAEAVHTPSIARPPPIAVSRRASARPIVALMMMAVLLPIAGRAEGALTGSVGLVSNYVYRGISQTDNGAALQLGANYVNRAGWFAGVWGSNVDPYPGGTTFEEIDGYAGVIRPLGPDFSAKATYTHYAYLNDPRPARYDFDELSVSVLYLNLVSASISYQPNYTAYSQLGFAQRRASLAYELSGRWPLGGGFALTAAAGYYDLQDLFGVSYTAGNAGLSYVLRGLTLSASGFYSSSNASRLYENASANHAFVVSALWRF